jgi:serine/threonine protein kinase
MPDLRGRVAPAGLCWLTVVSVPDIPGHKVGGVVGTGGFATVYRTWQVAVGRETAVKVDSRVLHTERDQRRFFREVTAAGRLSGHPNVVDVYDAGTLRDGRPYLVMELCPGGSLNDALHRHGPMSPARVRDIGIRIGDALAAAHAAGVLHRDIKPANILVNRYGMVGLSDFGLASIMAVSGEQSATREARPPSRGMDGNHHRTQSPPLAPRHAAHRAHRHLRPGRGRCRSPGCPLSRSPERGEPGAAGRVQPGAARRFPVRRHARRVRDPDGHQRLPGGIGFVRRGTLPAGPGT